jgi:serine/threonine protein kinase
MTLDPGVVLQQRYRIEHLHRLGRMGAVYLAVDLSLHVPVALKENLISGPVSARQFQREAYFLATLRHPNLPRATDQFVVEGQGQYFVMSFIEGATADEWIAQRSASPAEVVSAFHGVFQALMYIHSLMPPVVHRDVEPTNIIVSHDRQSFLVDFGLANALSESPSPAGTDARSDQYSLAATLYALMTHRIPANAVERALGKADLAPASSLNAAVPMNLSKALHRALSVKREDRYPDIKAFWSAMVGKS